MIDYDAILRSEMGPALAVIDLDATEALQGSADVDIDCRWEGTGLDSNESARLELASQTYAVRLGWKVPGAGARIIRSVVTGLGTDLMEASFDAFSQVAGVDPSMSDATWELTDTGARIQVWRRSGEHLIANLVAL